MAATTELIPDRMSPWRGARRWLGYLTLGYLGILIVILALESWFIYRPVSAAQSWIEPTDPAIRDVYFDLPTGERIHAFWRLRPGAKRGVLYCHGNAGNVSHRAGGLARWADTLDSSVLMFDYPGFGRSTGSPSERSCYAAGEAAWTWLTGEQRIAPEDVTLIGASLGGAVATDLAREHGCRALVLIKAFTSIPDMAYSRFPWLPARYFVRHRFDNLSKLPFVRRPTFVVHGTADRVVPFVHGERLFAAANEPKEFFAIPDNDHNDKLPDEMFDRLRQFVETHP
jgi:fermentation-respiration switch protein FrsA (DUF1100 family)